MTHERDSESAHSSLLPETNPAFHRPQYAQKETPVMSSAGLFDTPDSLEYNLSGGWLLRSNWDSVGSTTPSSRTDRSPSRTAPQLEEFPDPRPRKRQRINFQDFATQARLQQYHEQRQRLLTARRRTLQKTIALSARLKRTNCWIRDGLVEISQEQDPVAFSRVYQHAQDLVDFCHSQWDHELRNSKSGDAIDSSATTERSPASFLSQLAPNLRNDFLELIETLRNNPQFLVERFRSLSASQVAALSGYPKFEAFSGSEWSRVSNGSERQLQQRKLLQFSKNLEDYATSFERSSPLSLLLFNVYGTDQTTEAHEGQLRLSTWSTICAELVSTNHETAKTLLGQVLYAFAVMYDWHAKKRVELFLMDHLQKGAFLLEDDPQHSSSFGYDPLATPEAQQFFDKAAHELLFILADSGGGGYPTGALQLANAILGKLPTLEARSNFRGYFFSMWFFEYFLRTAVSYPETENMLLKVHISKAAREKLLGRMIHLTICKVDTLQREGAFNADDSAMLCDISVMINAIAENEAVFDPYQIQDAEQTETNATEALQQPSITLCAAEIVQLLEALSPQFRLGDQRNFDSRFSFDPVFLRETRFAFQAQYSSASNRFDRLKMELRHSVLGPGSSINDSHPCQEAWLQLLIGTNGRLSEVSESDSLTPNALLPAFTEELDIVQQAAVRLCAEECGMSEMADSRNLNLPSCNPAVLKDLFSHKVTASGNQTQNVQSIYWKKALKHLAVNYPLSELLGDDSAVLSSPLERLKSFQQDSVNHCTLIENQLSVLEKVFSNAKAELARFGACLEQLRLKLWYSKQVTHWAEYDDARNVAAALNHMSLSSIRKTTSIRSFSNVNKRPPSSRSAFSSILGQQKKDAISLLKAPTEFGGPKKLADTQIDKTKRWLQRRNVDNFCKGEERIHRFCMEVKALAQRLTGETLTESPELWSSDLFARESSLYDIQAIGINSAPASTRPASFMSDSISSTYLSSRPTALTPDSDARSVMSDEPRQLFRRPSVFSMVSSRINPQILMPDLASSIGSNGRASSAITGSESSIFSKSSRSLTSTSAYSRPASIFNDNGLARFACNPKEKHKFLTKVQQGLTCLLLSDLGCLVWSWGSETDTWVSKAQETGTISSILDKRLTCDRLVSTSYETSSKHPKLVRSASMTGISMLPSQSDASSDTRFQQEGEHTDELDPDYLAALEDTLNQISQHVDPMDKLNAINEFGRIAQLQLDHEDQPTLSGNILTVPSDPPGSDLIRRKSLDSSFGSLSLYQYQQPKYRSPTSTTSTSTQESDFVHHLKRQLVILKPKTLFRDLQYVSAFASPDMLDKTSNGKAFLHLGLAALDYKRDLCCSMVDVADHIVAADSIKRRQSGTRVEQPVSLAAEYWKVAALEGNATAQRELAVLYLTHPEVLPIISLPLHKSEGIFRDEMMWERSVEGNSNSQALCLALHWMQQAALNGDKIAQRKLEEREGGVNVL